MGQWKLQNLPIWVMTLFGWFKRQWGQFAGSYTWMLQGGVGSRPLYELAQPEITARLSNVKSNNFVCLISFIAY